MSDKKIIDRINKLLAVANNTPHVAEAETAFRQANKLMIKHSVDEAILRAASDEAAKNRGFKVDEDTYYAFAPYGRAKVTLAHYLGQTLNVRVTFVEDGGGDYRMTWYGSKGDMELLYLIFSETAKFGMSELAKVKKEMGYKGRSFTHSYWSAYNARVGFRAQEMYEEVMREAPSGTELVLRNQLEVVNNHVEERHPNLRVSKTSAPKDLNGQIIGDITGQNADISLNHRVTA